MKAEDIQLLAREGLYLGRRIEGEVVETHISWVILSHMWVFKIKKPIRLSFLDYSSLESRAYFCDQEIQLNARFSSIYIRSCPITWNDGKWEMNGKRGVIHDYAVMMKRLPEDHRMDKMLQSGEGAPFLIEKLANKVALFHRSQPADNSLFNVKEARGIFNDILNNAHKYTDEQEEFLQKAVQWSDLFLEKHSRRLRERASLGWVRDLHGDLHTGNVFLTDPPVIFDCIEFSKSMRTIDLLYEVAFICMDLERFGKEDWSALFLETYLKKIPVLDPGRDKAIFNYFKCLRANIRAKVLGMDPSEDKRKDQSVYLALMERYIQQDG
ncbi:phosphotransferase [Cyclobacterium sp.]|uniref:phosphotransferase n=1 Tax=Cyclobacterium sp. TaxID=1966343 RepID=UPI0019C57383|nr:phosphotransferase [Cyclobacterium sp.]MBD3628957.1 phosphotransferase [Cyclobacterium sp.]